MEDRIFLFLMICVFMIKHLHSLKDLKFNKILGVHALRTIPGISLDECWTNCEQRPACGSIKYKRKTHLCQLNSGEQSMGLTTQVDVVLREKRDSTALKTVDCGPNTCNKGEVCDIESLECKIKECKPPKTADEVDIKGNMASVGSEKLYSCKDGFMPSKGNKSSTTAVCDRDGWRNDLECIPLTCKGLADMDELSSNMYKSYDEGSNMIIDIFCEFNSYNRIGYTFLAVDTLNPLIDISKHYTRTDHVMLRHVTNGDHEQFESKVQVLPAYQGRYNVSLFNSEHPDFNAPKKDVGESYLYMGFVPNSYGNHIGEVLGYSCNGYEFTFINSDNNKNNYFAIFESQTFVKTCWSGGYVWNGWILCSTHVDSTRHLPDAVFFNRYEIHMGGGGCLVQTCPNLNVDGTAFGMPFEY